MQYRLRTLLIVLAVGPLVLAGIALLYVATVVPNVIIFTVPTGFRGPIVVVEGANGKVTSSRREVMGLTVPNTGIVVIDDDSVFDHFRLRAVYADGSPLRVDYDVGDDTVAFRMGGESSQLGVQTHLRFFVGTRSEFDKCDYRELLQQIRRPLPQ
jgi:hypothetical protein